jgi:hypothetical protein
VRERGSSIVLERSKQWIGIDLIPWTCQITAAVIAADIIPMRDGSAVNIFWRVCVEDGVPQRREAFDTATGLGSIVVAESAVGNGAAAIEAAAVAPRLAIMLATSPVAADGAAGERQRPAVVDAAAITRRERIGCTSPLPLTVLLVSVSVPPPL